MADGTIFVSCGHQKEESMRCTKMGKIVTQGYDWHKNKKIPGRLWYSHVSLDVCRLMPLKPSAGFKTCLFSIICAGGGHLSVGADGFCGQNEWNALMDSRYESVWDSSPAQWVCGMEGGDIVDWSSFSSEDNNVIYPPTCLNAAGKHFVENYLKCLKLLVWRLVSLLTRVCFLPLFIVFFFKF